MSEQPKLTKLTSVSCGTAPSDRGHLLQIKEVLEMLEWLEWDDSPEVMLRKISDIKHDLQESGNDK